MAHRPASSPNPSKANMRDPEAEQISASDDTPGTPPVLGGIVGMQLDENFGHGFRSNVHRSKPSQPHQTRQAKP
jgi:hypothetical protein